MREEGDGNMMITKINICIIQIRKTVTGWRSKERDKQRKREREIVSTQVNISITQIRKTVTKANI